jgi:hypothetical protein
MKSLGRRFETPLWTPLSALLLALAWLIPNTSQPWVAFQKELWAGVTFALLGLALTVRAARARRAFEVDPLALVLAGIGVYALLQWVTGLQYFFGHAVIGALYLLGAACAIVTGRAWETEQPGVVARWLFPAFLLGALGTFGFILKQWLGVDGLDIWTYPMPDNQRPFGNMLQPNNAATLLVLGVLAVFWLHERCDIGAGVLLLAAGCLVFGMVVTQSRTGYLNFLLLSAAGMVFAPRVLGPRARWWILALVGWFAAASLIVAEANAAMNLENVLAERTAGGRWQAWVAFTVAALTRPLGGLGFASGVVPQITAAHAGHSLDGYFAWTHNTVLDVAVWFGIPAALALVAAGGYLVRRLAGAALTPRLAFLAAAAFVPVLHGMLELPLAYAYFLLPVALVFGAISAQLALPAWRLDARLMLLLVGVLAASTMLVAMDYLKMERSVYALRFKAAHVGRTHVLDLPETLLLNQHRAYVIGMRLPVGAMDEQQLRDFEHAVALEPSPAALHRLVTRLVSDGDLPRAGYWIEAARQISAPEQRRLMAVAWRQLGARDGKYAQVQWPE